MQWRYWLWGERSQLLLSHSLKCWKGMGHILAMGELATGEVEEHWQWGLLQSQSLSRSQTGLQGKCKHLKKSAELKISSLQFSFCWLSPDCPLGSPFELPRCLQQSACRCATQRLLQSSDMLGICPGISQPGSSAVWHEHSCYLQISKWDQY